MMPTPKNIRQMGAQEDRIKVYLEDYVNTYLMKLHKLQEETGTAGVLVGQWDTDPTEENVFVRGAMALTEADLSGGGIHFSPRAWDQGDQDWATYFNGQQLCGLFVCEGSCRRIRRQALFGAVREYFPERTGLLYLLTQEGEAVVYRITPKQEERLLGYYCYFEKNPSMQEYMMDKLPPQRVESEGYVMPSERYQNQRLERDTGRAGAKGWGTVVLCACLALVIAVSGGKLVQEEYGGVQIDDLLQRLKIQVEDWNVVSVFMEETGEYYEASVPVMVEEIPGNVYPTETYAENPQETLQEGMQEEETVQESTIAIASNDESVSEESSFDHMQEGSVETEIDESQETTEAAAPSLSVSGNVLYVVQAGDSLYAISRRFYGTETMVDVIREMNQLENADLIKEGQELWLP